MNIGGVAACSAGTDLVAAGELLLIDCAPNVVVGAFLTDAKGLGGTSSGFVVCVVGAFLIAPNGLNGGASDCVLLLFVVLPNPPNTAFAGEPSGVVVPAEEKRLPAGFSGEAASPSFLSRMLWKRFAVLDIFGEAVTGWGLLLVSDRTRLAGSLAAGSSSKGLFVADATAGNLCSFTLRASDKYAFMISVQSTLFGNVPQAAKKLELSARKPDAEADCIS